NISLTTVEDKLAQIPMLRSPRNGYVRRIKPWVGKDGKYTTTVTISASVSSKNGDSDAFGGLRQRPVSTSPDPSSRSKATSQNPR
ncbi:MAG: hypothetical protein ACYTX0_50510, partial [Nostoc sp.]